MEAEYARTESTVEARSEACRVDGQAIKTHYPRLVSYSNRKTFFFIFWVFLLMKPL